MSTTSSNTSRRTSSRLVVYAACSAWRMPRRTGGATPSAVAQRAKAEAIPIFYPGRRRASQAAQPILRGCLVCGTLGPNLRQPASGEADWEILRQALAKECHRRELRRDLCILCFHLATTPRARSAVLPPSGHKVSTDGSSESIQIDLRRPLADRTALMAFRAIVSVAHARAHLCNSKLLRD
jgi:hypothetical protein